MLREFNEVEATETTEEPIQFVCFHVALLQGLGFQEQLTKHC